MASKPVKIIIDTNFWISYLISDNYKFLDTHIKKGNIQILFSSELLNEITEVILRPKFKKYFAKQDIEKLLRLFDSYGIFVEVISNVKKCRDPKVNFLLSLAIDSKADYLISGDNDLLELLEIEKTKIITIKDFKNILDQ